MSDEVFGNSTLLCEFPFWRDGMDPEEFEKEREYFFKHIDDWKKGKYVPLWKQQ